MEEIVTKINCPHCGAPVANAQRTGMIKCLYCNQTFQRSAVVESKDETHTQYLPPSLSDEDCKLLVIRDLVITDNVPIDIFDTLEIEVQAKKLYPFYIYYLDWSANWSATFTKEVSHQEPKYDYQGRRDGTKTVYETLYRDANGTSAGNLPVSVGGGANDTLLCMREVCNYYNTNGADEMLFANVEDYDNVPDGWIEIAANEVDKVYHNRRTQIEEFLNIVINKVAGRDASYMASGWALENLHFTYNYRQTKYPECVFRPMWEMKCKYNNESFDGVVDASQETFLVNPPQDGIEKERIKSLDEVINKSPNTAAVFCLFAAALSVSFLFIGLVGDSSVLLLLSVLFFLIFIPFLGVWIAINKSARNAKEEKKAILSNSIQKRKAAALHRFPKLVELIEFVPKNQDKE